MTSSEFETEATRPLSARCDEAFVAVALADGREIGMPLWWYLFPESASPAERAAVELMFEGVWWPVVSEGILVKSMLLGWKAVGAVAPAVAAA